MRILLAISVWFFAFSFPCIVQQVYAQNSILLNSYRFVVGDEMTIGSGKLAGRVKLRLRKVTPERVTFELESIETLPGNFEKKSDVIWSVYGERCFEVPSFRPGLKTFYCFRNRVNSPYEYTFFLKTEGTQK